MNMEITVCTNRTEALAERLVGIWDRSVRVSHGFLTESDIEQLRPMVRQAVREIPVLAVAAEGEDIIGFAGVAERKIEMLFVAPEYIGKGVGGRLLRWAIREQGAQYIDVNEQNPLATAVYEHTGFQVYERSETDDQGQAFPILRMKLTDNKQHV